MTTPPALVEYERVKKWDGALEPAHDCIVAHLPVKFDYGTSCGFLACYESLEALREEHPDASYVTFNAQEASNG